MNQFQYLDWVIEEARKKAWGNLKFRIPFLLVLVAVFTPYAVASLGWIVLRLYADIPHLIVLMIIFIASSWVLIWTFRQVLHLKK